MKISVQRSAISISFISGAVRMIGGREYLDFELSPAFAMVDHQVAHIYSKSRT